MSRSTPNAVVAVRMAMLALVTALTTSAVAQELEPGQIVLAYQPQLSGDPAQDFARPVASGEVFTVYLIAGPLPQSARGFNLGIGISEAANILLGKVRAVGEVLADQNSIGTFLGVRVSIETCRAFAEQTVLAEIDLIRLGQAIPLQLHLGGDYEPAEPPEFLNCAGSAVAFDDSRAQPLSVDAPVAVEASTWAAVKNVYRRR